MGARGAAAGAGRAVDAIVVGGGLIGCMAARALARDGRSVLLVEREPHLGRGASIAAAGMLAPQMEAVEDLLVEAPGPEAGRAMFELCLAARRGYAAFVAELEAETGRRVGYRGEGTLVVALTPVEAGRLGKSAAAQRERGLRAESLEPDEARRLEPAVTTALAGALLLPDDHQVDAAALTAAAAAAARAAPRVRIATGTAVRSILTGGDRVRGVRTDGARHEAPLVVLAAGAWSGIVDGLPRPLAVRPVKGQMAALRPVGGPPIAHVVGARGAYCIPRHDGRVLIGATVEERGFDARVSAIEVDALVRAAAEFLPPLAAAPVVDRWAGLRPGTADSLPVIGYDPDLEGLLHATGHYRNGILLASLTARCLAALAAGMDPPVDLAPFDPGRPALKGWGAPADPSSRSASGGR